MFFGDHDIDAIAFYSWTWDQNRGLTERSWEQAKGMYHERAVFVVLCMNTRTLREEILS